ncbi:nucleotidyltransferase domain-containing protein [bacterium]|nr:MAG: nucleotidyltransferase domain-containing protein [bacterium]
MLSERILSTIKFFDLQDYPLTSFEVWRYLVSDLSALKSRIDGTYELPLDLPEGTGSVVHFDTLLANLDILCKEGKLVSKHGFYALNKEQVNGSVIVNSGDTNLIDKRLQAYRYGLRREKLMRRYIGFTRHLPFVRGISLAGSQAFGLQRPTSDIDLLIITDSRFMWLARIFLSVYFQVLGVRRHGKKIINRFCLNHYIANTREVDAERNLYKAMEYAKLRPLVYPQTTRQFQKANEKWIKVFFPNANFNTDLHEPQSVVQAFWELLLNHRAGLWLERQLGQIQLKRIKQDKFIFVKDDELSFHPESKHEALLKGFFG